MPGPRRQSTVHQLPPGEPMGEGELGIGAYFAPQPEHGLMSWEHIQQVVAQDDLDYLIRHPDCENRYIAWGKGIREHYGGLENYICQVRLGWEKSDGLLSTDRINGVPVEKGDGLLCNSSDGADVDPRSFFSDEVAIDTNLVKMIPNDWPYAMPAECGHSVIWCKVPILDKVLFAGKDTPFPAGPVREAVYKAVEIDGIRGLSGNERRIASVGHKTKGLLAESAEVKSWMRETMGGGMSADGNLALVAERAQAWAGRFIDKYVKAQWPEQDWETAYFCNPPHLRTVPGLSHFQ